MSAKNKLSRLGGWMLLTCGVALTGCGGSDSGSGGGSGGASAPAANELSLAATAGEAFFHDKSLSASGLCGPLMPDPRDGGARQDLSRLTPTCGQFKVPTLRNIALTAPYFHNGMFATLHEAVQWYVTRDINNSTGNNPMPVTAGPGGNPYFPLGTFYTAALHGPEVLRRAVTHSDRRRDR